MMDDEMMIHRLMRDFNYTEKGAERAVKNLRHADPQIQSAFWAWFEDGTFPQVAVEGYDVPRLMSEQGMNPIAALLTLDYLLREPEKAKVVLKRGHDRIG